MFHLKVDCLHIHVTATQTLLLHLLLLQPLLLLLLLPPNHLPNLPQIRRLLNIQLPP